MSYVQENDSTVGMRTLGCGLSNLSGAKSRKEKIRLE